MNTISIAGSAMLVDVSISCWSARKMDKKVSDEVNTGKGASKRAARVNKNLLADDPRLEAIQKYAADTRNWLARVTVPWSDYGTRLVTTAQFFDFKQALDERVNEFNRLVADFITVYPTLISAQAFKLGAMFDRNEFPDVNDITRKFSMRYAFMPLPESGDFRVDIGNQASAQLKQEYESEYHRRVNEAMSDVWGRLKGVLDKLSERLGRDEIGKNKVFRDTLVSNAIEVCDMLRYLNVTQDPELEKARRLTEQALLGITAQDLREEDSVRDDVKKRVDNILDKFDW